MPQIGLVRIDSRLIHGQVCTQWLYRTGSKKVYIIDDVDSKDAFLSSIYKMACPVGVELETISSEEAAKRWNENEFGDVGPIFVLFKSMPAAYAAYKAGFHFPNMQVGGIGGGKNRKNIMGPIAFSDKDAEMLDEIVKEGLHAYFQPVPDDKPIEWEEIKRKHYPNL